MTDTAWPDSGSGHAAGRIGPEYGPVQFSEYNGLFNYIPSTNPANFSIIQAAAIHTKAIRIIRPGARPAGVPGLPGGLEFGVFVSDRASGADWLLEDPEGRGAEAAVPPKRNRTATGGPAAQGTGSERLAELVLASHGPRIENGILFLCAPTPFLARYIDIQHHSQVLAAIVATNPAVRDVKFEKPPGNGPRGMSPE